MIKAMLESQFTKNKDNIKYMCNEKNWRYCKDPKQKLNAHYKWSLLLGPRNRLNKKEGPKLRCKSKGTNAAHFSGGMNMFMPPSK